jgi:hypothetical protein
MKKLALWLALAASFCLSAQAQNYPTKPIRLIVPFAPGGGNDTVARAIAQQLTSTLNRTTTCTRQARSCAPPPLQQACPSNGSRRSTYVWRYGWHGRRPNGYCSHRYGFRCRL